MSTQDPVALLESLKAAQLREQIAELDNRRAALVVLLRAAAVRERREQARASAGKEASRAR
jgi:hypothetical protein